MDIIMSEEFAEGVFILGTFVVSGIVWYGYRKDTFSPWLAWLTTLSFVSYMVAFLGHRYLYGEVAEHVAQKSGYVLLGAIHGIISLAAIVFTCVLFIRAERAFSRGENYFKSHALFSRVTILLWPLALLTGFLMG